MAIADLPRSSQVPSVSCGDGSIEHVLNTLEAGVVAISLDGTVRVWNRAAEQATGHRAGEVLGRSLQEAVGLPLASPAVTAALAAVRAGHTWTGTVDLVDRDGAALTVHAEVFPSFAGEATPEAALAFCRRLGPERLRRRDEDLDWATRVRAALAEDRLELHAQPIVRADDRTVVTHELLLRLRERDGTIVLPGEFLAAIEKSGLIERVDRWVMARAAELAAEGWAVEFNLSARSVCSEDSFAFFEQVIARTGAAPALMVIELTETALLGDETVAALSLDRLKALGCRVALDDFGTGYGTFRYLKRFPVDYLKIDREFVRDLTTNGASWHVVRVIVSLARSFGQWTVAEGVEDEATLEILADLGVDFAQGFGIARPAPAAEVFARASSL